MRSRLWIIAAALLAIGLPLTVAACGSSDDDSSSGNSDVSGSIKIDGSSTVGPLTEAAAELFREESPNVNITVGISGTGGGFEKFCAGETQISDASREIEKEEIDACKKEGITYTAIQVANDGIANIISPENDWADCLTTAQLKKIWAPKSNVNNWNQVDSKFPDQAMKLFGPGTDSGTFDYYTEQINGEEGATRKDYSPSEDDNVIVQGVAGDKGNIGYLGLSYALENADKVKVVKVDSGDGCVEPTNETVQNGTYKPLSRPLYIYVSNKAMSEPQVKAFVDYYAGNTSTIAEQADFVPLTSEQETEAKDAATKAAG